MSLPLNIRNIGRSVRAGFTLVELLIVLTVILILATMMLAIRPTNPEGLGNAQRMMADMIRIAKVQASMNRASLPMPSGWTTANPWSPTNFRYRLLIKCDPANPDNHLREMVIAMGCTGIGPQPTTYTWFSPEPAVRLPPGIYFVPPNLAVANAMTGSPNPAVTMPTAVTLSGTSANKRLSKIPGLADTTGLVAGTFEYVGSAVTTTSPMMQFGPRATPLSLGGTVVYYNDPAGASHTVAKGGGYWYYVELGPDGSNNHTGKVVLVLAEGVNVGKQVLLNAPDKFAAILVRRNGDVSLTTDTDDLEATGTSTLLK